MPDFTLENQLNCKVAGIDEVGRGPLAGPVIAACAFIPETCKSHDVFAEIRDSKKLSATKREKLYPIIKDICAIGVGIVEPKEIDQINILQATFKAMTQAYEALPEKVNHILIDGNKCPQIPCPMTPVIKGDDTSLSIAAASIIAKVERDRLMTKLAQDYPQYGWERNAGYGTKQHLEALNIFGPTPYHRLSFAPLKQKTLPI